jgi:hypothetical protein
MTALEVARVTAWIALAIFTLYMTFDLRGAAEVRTRLAYLAAAVALGLHVLWSMLAVHQGSLQAAIEHTAQQTQTQVGVAVGESIYANFALLGLWLLDAAVWTLSPAWAQLRRKGRWVIWLILLFAHGFGRILGIAAHITILGVWLTAKRPQVVNQSDSMSD